MPEFEEKSLEEELSGLMTEIYRTVDVRVTFLDPSGTLLAAEGPKCELCKRTDANPLYADRCAACRAEAAKRSATSKDGIYFYRCWRGLMNATLHVESKGKPLGNFYVAGFRSEPEASDRTEQFLADCAIQLTNQELEGVPYIHSRRALDTIHTVGIAARYLVENYERQLSEKAQRDAEYRALQNQINQHFLFNALNSISQVSVLEGGVKTPELIYSLSALLRRSMKQNPGRIPLEEELEGIREYIKIKQMIGRSKIQYREQVDPEVRERPIPAFILQPLVENAVNHGLEEAGKDGTVSVISHLDGTSLVILVQDNGIGFNTELISKAKKNTGEITGLGIKNIFDRLTLIYGDCFQGTLHSAPGKGTTVELRLDT